MRDLVNTLIKCGKNDSDLVRRRNQYRTPTPTLNAAGYALQESIAAARCLACLCITLGDTMKPCVLPLYQALSQGEPREL